MVANIHIFHSGNNATKGHSHPPPPEWGSVCWLWVVPGLVRGKGQKDRSLSYPGCRPFSFWYTLTCPSFCTFKTCTCFSLLVLLVQSQHPSLFLLTEELSQHSYVQMSLAPVHILALLCPLLPGSTAVSFFRKCKREWVILSWRWGNTTSTSFPKWCLENILQKNWGIQGREGAG